MFAEAARLRREIADAEAEAAASMPDEPAEPPAPRAPEGLSVADRVPKSRLKNPLPSRGDAAAANGSPAATSVDAGLAQVVLPIARPDWSVEPTECFFAPRTKRAGVELKAFDVAVPCGVILEERDDESGAPIVVVGAVGDQSNAAAAGVLPGEFQRCREGVYLAQTRRFVFPHLFVIFFRSARAAVRPKRGRLTEIRPTHKRQPHHTNTSPHTRFHNQRTR